MLATRPILDAILERMIFTPNVHFSSPAPGTTIVGDLSDRR
jgi:hypothetical protein